MSESIYGRAIAEITRLRAALETATRERDEARAERRRAERLTEVVLRERDAALARLAEVERERDRLRGDRAMTAPAALELAIRYRSGEQRCPHEATVSGLACDCAPCLANLLLSQARSQMCVPYLPDLVATKAEHARCGARRAAAIEECARVVQAKTSHPTGHDGCTCVFCALSGEIRALASTPGEYVAVRRSALRLVLGRYCPPTVQGDFVDAPLGELREAAGRP